MFISGHRLSLEIFEEVINGLPHNTRESILSILHCEHCLKTVKERLGPPPKDNPPTDGYCFSNRFS